jgi:hypothetical protein
MDYNYERCSNNANEIRDLKSKLGELMNDIRKIDLIDQKLEIFEKDKLERRNSTRWIIGISLTILGLVASIAIAVWGKI